MFNSGITPLRTVSFPENSVHPTEDHMEHSSCPSTPDSMDDASSPKKQIDQLQPLHSSLVKLARDSYNTRKSKIIIAADYMRIQPKIAAFFEGTCQFNFLSDGTYGLCLEMKCLAQLIEMNVRSSSDFRYKSISWPSTALREEDERALSQTVYRDVDILVWGRSTSNTRSQKKLKMQKQVRKEWDSDIWNKPDSGYSSGDA